MSNPISVDLTWDNLESCTSTALATDVFYYVYRFNGYTSSTQTVVTSGSLISTTLETSISTSGQGTYSYVVIGTDTATGCNGYSDPSPVRYNHFIHKSLGPVSQDILRTDADGLQNGNGQQWNFDYKLQDDAYMTIAIYPPGTTFTTNASGFVTSASSSPVKTVLDNVPRSFQMVGDLFINEDFWDLRDSSGVIVSKGLYYALFAARSASDATTILDTVVKTIPNDSIRLSNIVASPITDTVSTSQISFNINADARVKVLISSPGTKFAVATAAGSLSYLTTTYSYVTGDSIPLNPSTLVADGNRILSVLDFNVVSGDQSFSWNGTDVSSNTLGSGIYAFAMSASDAFGNYATEISGNNYADWGSISINRLASQPFPVVVASVFPTPGAVVQSGLSSLYASLNYIGDNVVVDENRSTFSVMGPGQIPIYGTMRWNPTDRRMEYYLNNSLDEKGAYTIRIMARGSALIQGDFEMEYVSSFSVVPNSLQEAYISPNPIKNVNSARFRVPLNTNSTIRLAILNVLGEVVYERVESRSGGIQDLTWNLKNNQGQNIASGLYLYRIEVESIFGKEEITKKFIMVQ